MSCFADILYERPFRGSVSGHRSVLGFGSLDKVKNHCNRRRPGLIKDRQAQAFARVLFAEANSSLKADIRLDRSSGVVSGHSLVFI